MDSTTGKMGIEMECLYMKNINETFIIREAGNPDYRSAVVLLRNLAEKKDTTSLERDALSSAVRLLRQKLNVESGGNQT